MTTKTGLEFEYTPKIEECPECGGEIYVDVVCDSEARAYRFFACADCEWHEHLSDWIPLSHEDWWDWMCFSDLRDDSQWELKTRRVVKE